MKLLKMNPRRLYWLLRTARVAACLSVTIFPLCRNASAIAIPYTGKHTAAYEALQQGRADDALNMLHPMSPNDADAQNLLCRVFMAEERFDEAVPLCEQAVSLAPGNAMYQLTLAHANGGRAQHISPLIALPVAHRARDHFEAAAKLAPSNWGVLSDLGEYYVQAPSIAGGGVDKARQLIPHLMKLNAARGHWLTARVAEESKDYATAENEYKQAIATGQMVPEGDVNLAIFYNKRGRQNDAVEYIRKAEAADNERDPVLVDAATLLIQMNQETALALHMLRAYLTSSSRTEDAPAFAVHVQVGKILERDGDHAGATREFNEALALARDYAPAQKALHAQ
jgi:Flp pilus assembly protein TadD